MRALTFNADRVSTVWVAAAACTVVLALAAPAAAQNEAALKSYFEGKRVTLRIDMPGTSDGVDVHADASRAIDFNHYKDDLKRYGTAIRAGDGILVTLVKVKKDLIEFQLGGGGFRHLRRRHEHVREHQARGQERPRETTRETDPRRRRQRAPPRAAAGSRRPPGPA